MIKWFARYPIYPFLFVLISISSLVIHNARQLSLIFIVRPLFVIWIITSVLLLVIKKSTKNIHRAGFLITLGLVGVLSFGVVVISIQRLLPGLNKYLVGFMVLVLWVLILSFLGHPKLWRKVTKPMFLTFVLNLIFLFSLLYPIGSYGQFLLQRDTIEKDTSSLPFLSEQKLTLSAEHTPDIYLIVLDGYGRSDCIEELYRVDTRPFLKELEWRGFYVAEKSHSNYMQTWLSVSAVLNFQYHGVWDPPSNPMVFNRYIRTPITNNRLMAALNDIGYKIISFDIGFQFLNQSEVASFDSPFARLNPLEEMLLANTPLQLIADQVDIGVPIYNYRTHVTRLNNLLAGLKAAPEDPGPIFAYAHVLLPHPPFIFDRDGNYTEPNRPYGGFDGDDFDGSPEEYYYGYREQVQYTSRLILNVIDEILAKSEEPPIILLQGDHGPGLFYGWDGVDQTCVFERSSILNALYLPGIDPNQLYPELSPVNSFRIVLNNYFNQKLELLPDLTFYSTQTNVEVMTDVTEIRDTKKNCENLFPNQPVEVFSIP